MVIGPKGLIVIVLANAFVIATAVALRLHGSWQASVVVVAALFFLNVFGAFYLSRRQSLQMPSSGQRKIWLLGVALIAAGVIRLLLCIWEGFSSAAIGGSVTGLLVGALFILIALRADRVALPNQTKVGRKEDDLTS